MVTPSLPVIQTIHFGIIPDSSLYLHSRSVSSASAWLQPPPFLALTHVRASCPPFTLASLSLIATEVRSFHLSAQDPAVVPLPVRGDPQALLWLMRLCVTSLCIKQHPCHSVFPITRHPCIRTAVYVYTHTLSFSLCCNMSFVRGDTLSCIPLVPQTVPVRKKHSGITEHVNDQISVLIDRFAISGKLGRPAGKVTLCTKDKSLHWGSGVSTDRRGDVEKFWSRVNRSAVG